ncbi:hypothetical protein [Rhodococcus sp. KRD162]|uniref:hypothetical protein n=1 Tax=Rhodococcus sp. KRD162 TaxID=2729725 RepID=UPI0019D00775|nr:hypothetical protein [Rhodococcus sp. KRD162]
MKIFPHLPTNTRDRIRTLFNRHPVTPIVNWDAREPIPQPVPDLDAAVATVEAMIDDHADAGSVDSAHADVLDRLIASVTDQWRDAAKLHFLNQATALASLRAQGVQHLTRVGTDLAEIRREHGRHQSFYEGRWKALTDESERLELQVADPATTRGSLPELQQHPLNELSISRVYAPFTPVLLPGGAADTDTDTDTDKAV